MSSAASEAVNSSPGRSTTQNHLGVSVPGMPIVEPSSSQVGGGQRVGIKPSPQRLHHRPLSPHHRSTLTPQASIGTPIPSRIRSQSIGNHPYSMGPPVLPTMSPYSVRSLPASPMMGSSLQTKIGGPNMPFLPPAPPEHSETHKAMESAAASERTRAKLLEEEEKHLNADDLRAVLKRERTRMGRIAADVAAMKSAAVQSQLEAEVIEEGRINCLMRRLDTVQQEKGRIIVELEREEEMLTNTLQKKLNEVRKEKAILEKEIEHEKKSHMVLEAQLTGLRDNHLPIAEALEEEDEIEEEN